MSLTVRVLRTPDADPDVPLPVYKTAGAAGADLYANFPEGARGGVTVPPGGRVRVPTGLILELPEGHEGQVRPRSGLAWSEGLTVLNAPGTIDSDYRAEVMVLLVNLGAAPVVVRHGTRIAQLVLAPVTRATFAAADTVGATARGTGGFGSTGRD
ncbi:dUTP diphosphatase [Rhodobacteraceae bacterium CCMM004]|nr:dUTP diphosphatase [Rhodobacteraceae bacterium CCMM004]